MFHCLTTLLLASALPVAPNLADGTMLSFRGTMIAEKGDPIDTRKSFELTVIVKDRDAGSATLLWTVSEKGRGGWPWPARFGSWQVDANGRRTDGAGPSLLYDRGEGLSEVPLIAPILGREKPLAKGAKWSVEKFTHRVLESQRINKADTWQVEVSSAYGHKRTMWLDKSRSTLVKLVETVFIGQGEQHELKLELVESKRLSAENLNKMSNAFAALSKLRQEVKAESRAHTVNWNPTQLAALKDELPAIAKLSAGGPLATVVAAAESDTTDQKDRTRTVAALRKMVVGKKAAEFDLATLAGKRLTEKDLTDNVTVLHFWHYKDRPLNEPYGQIGYLDFLNRQLKSKQVKIYGVTVDERLARPSQRSQAIASAKKLKSFMNLSYPILLDDGKVIKKFGDPRITDTKLPLYIVIGQDGKVLHYHAGLYKVDRDRGLIELDEVIKKASESRE